MRIPRWNSTVLIRLEGKCSKSRRCIFLTAAPSCHIAFHFATLPQRFRAQDCTHAHRGCRTSRAPTQMKRIVYAFPLVKQILRTPRTFLRTGFPLCFCCRGFSILVSGPQSYVNDVMIKHEIIQHLGSGDAWACTRWPALAPPS